MPASEKNLLFDYRALRLLVGIIAIGLPMVVVILAQPLPSSISASYYTAARDSFVGLLFAISALLIAYEGHSAREAWASRVAAVAAAVVALFPTSCDQCPTDAISLIHYGSAGVVFLILAYFCFGPFRTSAQRKGAKGQSRAVVYIVCGVGIVLAMLGMVGAKFVLTEDAIRTGQIMFWLEGLALWSFGVAWFVACQIFVLQWLGLVDADEAYRPTLEQR